MRPEPFAIAHGQSRIERLAAPPDTLDGLLLWFRKEWADDMPVRLHDHYLDDGGAPRLAPAFRAFIDSSPFSTDQDGFYRWPIRAALAFTARGDPFMARFLFGLAHNGGDWRGLCDRIGIPPQVAPVYTHEALRRIRVAFRDFPTVRVSRN